MFFLLHKLKKKKLKIFSRCTLLITGTRDVTQTKMCSSAFHFITEGYTVLYCISVSIRRVYHTVYHSSSTVS